MTGPDGEGWDSGPDPAPAHALRLANEFASVWVAIEDTANGVRLQIADAATGQVILLDPLQLEALAWARHEDLRFLMTPGYRESVARSPERDDRG